MEAPVVKGRDGVGLGGDERKREERKAVCLGRENTDEGGFFVTEREREREE